jgi:hypothetical protein
MKKTTAPNISRRDMVRLTGTAGLGMSILANTPLFAVSQKSPAPPKSTPRAAPKSPSVFENDDCREGSSIKYASYDKDIVYPLLAFWLMLTTDEWDECFKDAKWRTRLASELSLNPQHLEHLYAKSHSTERPANDADKKNIGECTNLQAFNRVKKIWYDFIEEYSFYGGRPCPGGKTLLQIASGCKK